MQTRIVTVDPGTGPDPDRMQTRIVTVDPGTGPETRNSYGFLWVPIDSYRFLWIRYGFL